MAENTCSGRVVGGKPLEFDETDKREIEIVYTPKDFSKKRVIWHIHQIDFLRLERICGRIGMSRFANKIVEFIKRCDEEDGRKTNFERKKLPRSELR